ncbi:phytoene/squalene synthase family protein [Sphingomonas mesophila]|uniref:phytoene/squalene synthase family protein n=1 Tax=Sphingomonas mesophila TaxID=2303576 RepID=UPI000E596938|nr:phytoene/squalene synthase family protein [Sphingomonas mesophila]
MRALYTRAELVEGARQAIVAGSKSFRAASRLFDRETRERAWLLYWWCRHCDDACDGQTMGFGSGPKSPVAGLREKTLLAAAGQRVGEGPFDALGMLLRERPIPVSMLEDHLAGFALDERGWRPQTEEDLDRYCYHVAGVVGCMMAIVMGISPDDRETLERAADLGIAFQLSNIARDLREDSEAGRCYVPASWLADLGNHCTVHSAIATRLVDRVAAYEASARSGVAQLPFRSRVAVLAALRIYGAIGREVGRLGDQAWDRRVTIGKARKLGFLLPSLAEAARTRRA